MEKQKNVQETKYDIIYLHIGGKAATDLYPKKKQDALEKPYFITEAQKVGLNTLSIMVDKEFTEENIQETSTQKDIIRIKKEIKTEEDIKNILKKYNLNDNGLTIVHDGTTIQLEYLEATEKILQNNVNNKNMIFSAGCLGSEIENLKERCEYYYNTEEGKNHSKEKNFKMNKMSYVCNSDYNITQNEKLVKFKLTPEEQKKRFYLNTTDSSELDMKAFKEEFKIPEVTAKVQTKKMINDIKKWTKVTYNNKTKSSNALQTYEIPYQICGTNQTKKTLKQFFPSYSNIKGASITERCGLDHIQINDENEFQNVLMEKILAKNNSKLKAK